MRRLAAGVATAALVIAGCGAGASEDTIPIQDPDLVESGSTLYAANCAKCHGEDLRGTDQGPSHLSEVYEPGHHSDEAFLVAVMTGVTPHHWDYGPMPAMQGLTEENVEAIVAFVRETQRVQGFEPYPP